MKLKNGKRVNWSNITVTLGGEELIGAKVNYFKPRKRFCYHITELLIGTWFYYDNGSIEFVGKPRIKLKTGETK